MLPIDRLISHRFRGFAREENTIDGLNAALSFGVQQLEFDIRIAKCGTPMIYHDEAALDAAGKLRKICDVMASEFSPVNQGGVGGRFATMPSAQALFKAASLHPNKDARLLIDVKDAGFEEAIHALVSLYRLNSRAVYVSWIPEVLYQFHEIAEDVPLCFSHWCQNPDAQIRYLHTVFESLDGHIPQTETVIILGQRSGYYVKDGLSGGLRNMLIKTGGSVCVPQHMATEHLVSDYQNDGIKVSTFSYITWPAIEAHAAAMNIDLFFIDNKKVFDQLNFDRRI